jgi:hypothetical protein
MVDVDTFLTALYVMVDDFYKSPPPKRRCPGPDASLSPSEIITLAIFARWSRFASERDFYRFACNYLSEAFPTLPERSQFDRCVRLYTELIDEMALHLAEVLEASECPCEALDSSAMPFLGMPSAEVPVGWPVAQTSDGPILWCGMRACVCWWPQLLQASSRALACVPLQPPTSSLP